MTITWEPDFSKACIFCRMLMNHKNFCFTPIPDKTNTTILLKSPKTLFWGPFLSFLPDGIFSKKFGSVTHNYRLTQPFILPKLVKWVPGISGNLVAKSKLHPQSGSSLAAVELHPWKGAIKFLIFLKDGWTLVYRTLLAVAGDPKKLL